LIEIEIWDLPLPQGLPGAWREYRYRVWSVMAGTFRFGRCDSSNFGARRNPRRNGSRGQYFCWPDEGRALPL